MNLSEQKSETTQLLLAAQDRLYAKAKANIWLLYLASAVPFIALLFRPFIPSLDHLLAVVGVLGLIIGFAMEQWTKKRVETAARIQEEVDLRIYGNSLPPNEGLTGGKVGEQITVDAAGDYRLPDHRLPWYSAVIEKVTEPSVQVVLCQRENAAWDWRTKNYIASRLTYLLFILIVLVFIIGIFSKDSASQALNARQLVLSIIVPASALIFKTWQLRQSFYETGKARQSLDEEIMQEIEKFKKIRQPILPDRLRIFQDKIYKTRLENCIVPDWLHERLQVGLQKNTTKSTEMIVTEINKTV